MASDEQSETQTPVTWGTRSDLSQATIETILAEIDGIARLGTFTAAETVPYPVTGIDVADAVRYILEKDVVGAFARLFEASKEEGSQPVNVVYPIPIGEKTQHGRSTPDIFFQLNPTSDDDVFSGSLFHRYLNQPDQKDRHNIVLFHSIQADYKPSATDTTQVESPYHQNSV